MFDVKNFFTNVLLEEIVGIIFTKIYDENKTKTNILQNILKGLLYSCVKHVNFTYGRNIYSQIDRVAMGAPLDLLLVDIFMMSLEKAILPTIKNHVVHWSRYVHDTHAYINPQNLNLF